MAEAISDVDLDVIHYIERFHATNGEAPSGEQIRQRFELPDNYLENFQKNPLVQKSLATRGIMYPAAVDRFTPEQMHAAAVMMDNLDRRSDAKKLQDLGITTRQWSEWMQDRQFSEYIRSRSELMLQNSVYEAHKGLVKGARNGNVASIKTLYQITGRHDPDRESQVNVRQILHTFIEVIQKYVKDPYILHEIARDLSSIASRESYSHAIADNMMQSDRPAIQATAMNGTLGPAPTLDGD